MQMAEDRPWGGRGHTRPAAGGSAPVPPPPPEGLPPAPAHVLTQAQINREDAVAKFFTALTSLATKGEALLDQEMANAKAEAEELAERQSRLRQR